MHWYRDKITKRVEEKKETMKGSFSGVDKKKIKALHNHYMRSCDEKICYKKSLEKKSLVKI